MQKIGRQVHMLTIGEGNPRNGEGSFISLKDGRILFAYSRAIGRDWSDHGAMEIAAIESSDSGEHWSEPRVLFGNLADEMNNMCASLLRMQNGDIGLFYAAKYKNPEGKVNLRVMFRRSCDEGASWQAPSVAFDGDDYFVLENDRALRLSSGRILVPLNLHTNKGEAAFGAGEITFFYSDDDGASFHPTNRYYTLTEEEKDKVGLQETGVLELSDGRIFCFSRTAKEYQYTAVSEDGGLTFTQPVRNRVISSAVLSPMGAKRIGGAILAVLNPNDRGEKHFEEFRARRGSRAWSRTPLLCAISTDDMQSFDRVFAAEDDPENGYCYTAIHEEKDFLLLAYYHSNDGECPLTCQKLLKIQKSELGLA